MNRLSIFILLLGAFASMVAAASPPTFCKCTCFTNSTIIEIKSKSSTIPGTHAKEPDTSNDEDGDDSKTEETPSPDSTPAPSAGTDDDPLSLLDALEDDPALDPIIPRAAARQTQTTGSCSQCNRAFCLSQSLPICKGAAEKDVVTMCFQRDSRQDQVIVWGFILGTAGLLGYAALRKLLEMQEGGGFGGGGGGGLAAGLAGGLLRGDGGGSRDSGALPVGRGGVRGAGGGGDRGRYATVAGHSRESSGMM